MQRSLMVILIVTLFLFGLAGQALAYSWGAYVEGAQGTGDFEYVDLGGKFDVDTNATGYGLVFDSDTHGQQNFNLRFNVGYDKLDFEDDSGDTLELEGLMLASTFGFPLAGRESYRWWIGPQLRLGFYSGNVDGLPDVDYDLASFGVGGVLGFNYITRSNICISTSLGLLLSGYAGEASRYGYSDRDVEGSSSTAFINFAFMFGN